MRALKLQSVNAKASLLNSECKEIFNDPKRLSFLVSQRGARQQRIILQVSSVSANLGIEMRCVVLLANMR